MKISQVEADTRTAVSGAGHRGNQWGAATLRVPFVPNSRQDGHHRSLTSQTTCCGDRAFAPAGVVEFHIVRAHESSLTRQLAVGERICSHWKCAHELEDWQYACCDYCKKCPIYPALIFFPGPEHAAHHTVTILMMPAPVPAPALREYAHLD